MDCTLQVAKESTDVFREIKVKVRQISSPPEPFAAIAEHGLDNRVLALPFARQGTSFARFSVRC